MLVEYMFQSLICSKYKRTHAHTSLQCFRQWSGFLLCDRCHGWAAVGLNQLLTPACWTNFFHFAFLSPETYNSLAFHNHYPNPEPGNCTEMFVLPMCFWPFCDLYMFLFYIWPMNYVIWPKQYLKIWPSHPCVSRFLKSLKDKTVKDVFQNQEQNLFNNPYVLHTGIFTWFWSCTHKTKQSKRRKKTPPPQKQERLQKAVSLQFSFTGSQTLFRHDRAPVHKANTFGMNWNTYITPELTH